MPRASLRLPSPASKLGDWGEEVAGRFLERQGFRILDRKYRCTWGEVDLVTRDGRDLVFVEVRTRRSNSFGSPEESITDAKAGRLVATCNDYLQKHPDNLFGDHPDSVAGWRIDLVSVLPVPGKPPRISHLRNTIGDWEVGDSGS